MVVSSSWAMRQPRQSNTCHKRPPDHTNPRRGRPPRKKRESRDGRVARAAGLRSAGCQAAEGWESEPGDVPPPCRSYQPRPTHPESTMSQPRCRQTRPSLERLDSRQLLSGLTPAQMAHAYGFDSFHFVSNGRSIRADGSGQTIALIEAYHNPYLMNDLRTF